MRYSTVASLVLALASAAMLIVCEPAGSNVQCVIQGGLLCV